MINKILFDIAELKRQMANLITFGKVVAVDLEKATCRVRIGEILTAPIPWLTQRATKDESVWWSPKAGEQVLVLSPVGDYTQAVAIPAIYQNSAAPSSNNPDSCKIQMGSSQLELLKSGQIKISAPSQVLIDTPLVKVTGDVVAGDVSLKEHPHSGVRRGPSLTDPPVGGA